MPSIQFPYFIVHQFNTDQPPTGTEDKKEQTEFEDLNKMDQYFGLVDAYKYVEDFLAQQELQTLTVETMIDFISEIHRRSAYALTRPAGREAGIYASQRVGIAQETGMEKPKTFSLTSTSMNDNFYILRTKYGESQAQLYSDFSNALSDNVKLIHSETSQQPDVYLEAQKLSKMPGYALFMETIQFGASPLEIPRLMGEYAAELVRRLTDDFPANAQETAAFALHRLCEIHPFENGNGRVGRVLMNTILLMAEQNAISSECDKKGFYQAFKQSSKTGNLEPLIQLIARAQEQEHSPMDLAPLISPGGALGVEVEGQIMACLKEDGQYVFMLPKFLELYVSLMARSDGSPIDAVVSKMGLKKMTAEVLIKRAEGAQPMIARYYYWRAADFYGEMGDSAKQQEMLGEVAKMTEILQRQADPTQQYQSLLTEVRNKNSEGLNFYKQLEPRFELALKSFETAKEIIEKIKSNCHGLSSEQTKRIASEEATTLYNIGSCHRNLGDYDLAAANFKEAYTLRKEILGEEHASTQKAYEKWMGIVEEQISAKSLSSPSG